ncbi:Na+/melibiose symporter-like transporter [Paenibacillus taihuensis]|uniref:Na+/melibiose symporter-like transporter n=2 Tax=Paenibacillus taihuensis TaxID=1156355 RepID=A0A3D9S7L3_9BACL|nr:Na+/melibiose symporter-like transporter [Paenibacillus taihuensis]
MLWTKRFTKSKKQSDSRKYLKLITSEGISGGLLGSMLGGPFLTGFMLYLGASSAQIGFALAIPAFANLAQIFTAIITHNVDNRRAYVFGYGVLYRVLWVLTGLIPFVLPQSYWVYTFIALYLLSYLCSNIAGVIWASLIGDMVPAQVRGRYMGIRNTIVGGLAAAAVLAGGQILELFSKQNGFIILYIIAAVCMVWNGYHLFSYPNLPYERSQESQKLKLLVKPLKDRSFVRATLFLAAWIFFQNMAIPLFSYVMQEVLSISIQWVSVITTVQLIVMMTSYYVWGNLNAKYGTKRVLRWTLPIIAASCLLWGGIAWIPAIPVLILVHMLLGIGTGGFTQLTFNFTIEEAPSSERTIYVAVFAALTGFTGFLSPILGGEIYRNLKTMPAWVEHYGFSVGMGLVLLGLALTAGRSMLSTNQESYSRAASAIRDQQEELAS